MDARKPTSFEKEFARINVIEKEMKDVVTRLDRLRNEKHFLVSKMNRDIQRKPCHHCQKPSTRIIDAVHFSCDDCYYLD